MSTKAQKQNNKCEIDEINQDFGQDNNDSGTVDRTRMSWILNLILNKKTQEEIGKDIVDGILDFKEVEEIFPWNLVQKLRKDAPGQAQNYLQRFKNMTDERMKGLLSVMLSRKSRDEIHKLITDPTLGLDNIQKTFMQTHMTENEETSNATSSMSTSSKQLSSECPSNANVKNIKEPKDMETKKKRNTTKKGEKVAGTKKKGIDVDTAAKKVRVVKLKNEKRVGNVNGENKLEEAIQEISPMEDDPRADYQKSLADLEESLMRISDQRFEESSLNTQVDRAAKKLPARSDTKKTAKSKSLASGAAKLAGAKKASKKVVKDVKASVRNKGEREVESLASLPRNDDYTNEMEKSRSDESNVENEKAGTSFMLQSDRLPQMRNGEGFEDSLSKSRANQSANIPFFTNKEQDIRGNKENEPDVNVQECNFNTQFNSSTPKKLNYERKMIKIKEEPKHECSLDEYNNLIDYYHENLLSTHKGAFKKEDSPKKLLTKSCKMKQNKKAKSSETVVTETKKVTKPSRNAKAEKHHDDAKKENVGSRAKNKKHEESVETGRTKSRNVDRRERRKTEKMRRNEKKMEKAMVQFSGQVVKLVKNMGYLEDDESTSSRSSESESSYTSSSESCSCSSCSCCDYFSSDEYSEYTLCFCSNCSSSYSSTDSDHTNEE